MKILRLGKKLGIHGRLRDRGGKQMYTTVAQNKWNERASFYIFPTCDGSLEIVNTNEAFEVWLKL